MKKSVIIILLLVSSVNLFGCQNDISSTSTYDHPTINIPWASSEKLSYRVDDASGNTIGKVELIIEKDKDTDVYLLRQNNTSNDANMETLVAVNSKTLAPVYSSEIITSSTAGATLLDCRYTSDRVTVIMPVDVEEGEETTTVDTGSTVIAVPSGVFDNNELAFLGRTLPLKEGYYVELACFIVAQLSTPVISFSVAGKETLTAPAGTFECYKVKMSGIGDDTIQSTVWLWYAVKGTHPMVKYTSDSGSYTLLG
jgi:hypothetical protein